MAKQKEKEKEKSKESKSKKSLSLDQLIYTEVESKFETVATCIARCRYLVKHNEEHKSTREILLQSIRDVYESKVISK